MADENDRADDSKSAATAAAVLGAVFTVVALATSGGRAAFSVAVGAAIAVANLLTLRAIIRAIIRPPDDPPPEEGASDRSDHSGAGKRGGAAWGLFAVLKILFLFGGVWLLLTRDLVDPIPLVVGYGVLPLGIAASTLFASLAPRRR